MQACMQRTRARVCERVTRMRGCRASVRMTRSPMKRTPARVGAMRACIRRFHRPIPRTRVRVARLDAPLDASRAASTRTRPGVGVILTRVRRTLWQVTRMDACARAACATVREARMSFVATHWRTSFSASETPEPAVVVSARSGREVGTPARGRRPRVGPPAREHGYGDGGRSFRRCPLEL
jgi:hypothetical protein